MEAIVFKNCKDCKVNERCCTQLGKSFRLDGPVITEEEIKIISKKIRNQAPWYEVFNRTKENKTYSIKTDNHGRCIFYKNNKCDIYEARPFDCRIFPLDIFRINSKYYWICYTTFCEQEFNWNDILAYGQVLLNSKEKGVLDYFAVDVEYNKPSLSYKILEEIHITK